MRIICCGNRERGDDAAGLLAADHLEELGIVAEIQSGEPLALIDTWADDDEVIVVDTVVTGAAAGTVHIWNGAPPVTAPLPASTHGLGLAEAIRLGRELGRLPPRLSIYGIEGKQFSMGCQMATEVRRGVAKVVQEIVAHRDRCA